MRVAYCYKQSDLDWQAGGCTAELRRAHRKLAHPFHWGSRATRIRVAPSCSIDNQPDQYQATSRTTHLRELRLCQSANMRESSAEG